MSSPIKTTREIVNESPIVENRSWLSVESVKKTILELVVKDDWGYKVNVEQLKQKLGLM